MCGGGYYGDRLILAEFGGSFRVWQDEIITIDYFHCHFSLETSVSTHPSPSLARIFLSLPALSTPGLKWPSEEPQRDRWVEGKRSFAEDWMLFVCTPD